ncbi:MAG: hypothetical protein JSS82_08220 [Bacteroidetes bacterium]|nr:hypothetical protein [Bacteroidota bacterium]
MELIFRKKFLTELHFQLAFAFREREYSKRDMPLPGKKIDSKKTWTLRDTDGQYVSCKIFGTKSPTYFFNHIYFASKRGQTQLDFDAYYRALIYLNPNPVADKKEWAAMKDFKKLEVLQNAFIQRFYSDVNLFDDVVEDDPISLQRKLLPSKLSNALSQIESEVNHLGSKGNLDLYAITRDQIDAIFRTAEKKFPALGRHGENGLIALQPIFDRYVEPGLKNKHGTRIAWSYGITLVKPINFRNGWTLDEIDFGASSDFYELPSELQPEYIEYLPEFRKKYKENPNRYMLARTPFVSGQNQILKIEIKRCHWSHIKFFHELMENNSKRRVVYLDKALDYQPLEDIDFPNSVVLHYIIKSSDDKFLFLQRDCVGDQEGSWALTEGQQLDKKDVEHTTPREILLSWINAAVAELGLEKDIFEPRDVRFLALNLESNNINFAIPCVIKIKYTAKECEELLNKRLTYGVNLKDKKFLDEEGLFNELLNPSKFHHNSTGLRLLYALNHLIGHRKLEAELKKRVAL